MVGQETIKISNFGVPIPPKFTKIGSNHQNFQENSSNHKYVDDSEMLRPRVPEILATDVRGDREPEPGGLARGADDRGVDADDLAREVDQRAARDARVDRGVGLYELLVDRLHRVAADRPPLGADDARARRG